LLSALLGRERWDQGGNDIVANLTRQWLGKVMTVEGPVDPKSLGITNPHEHLIIDFLTVGAENQTSHQVAMQGQGVHGAWDEPISLATYYEARRNPFLFRDTLQLTDPQDAAEALGEYRDAGGGCIVDVTPIGVGRNPSALRGLAQRSGVKVVMGTGFYVKDYHPADLARMSEDAICDAIVSDIVDGSGSPSVRPGIIGEIGLVWPVHPDEAKVLRAAAKAQQKTGYFLTIHPGRNPAAPLDAIRTVEQAGGDPRRTIIDHIERTIFETADFLKVAKSGCFLEFDLFGLESSYYPMADIDMPNDALRVNMIAALAKAGHLDQVLVSLDIDSRARLVRYGGEGYAHIIKNVVPVFRRKGFTQTEIDLILAGTPQRALTIV
jgi:phosphotriesterase-related protein